MSTYEGDSEHNFIVPVRVRIIIYALPGKFSSDHK